MKMTFIPLAELHFPLLLKWLETPHVKAWWDSEVTWTPELIEQKYADYVKGFKQENGQAKAMKAFIICAENQPVGYIQFYHPRDFAHSKPLTGLPSNLAAIDFFIGEVTALKQGIGTQAITQFLDDFLRDIASDTFTHVWVDPESANFAAIKTYEKAGFKAIMINGSDAGETWMIREQAVSKIGSNPFLKKEQLK